MAIRTELSKDRGRVLVFFSHSLSVHCAGPVPKFSRKDATDSANLDCLDCLMGVKRDLRCSLASENNRSRKRGLANILPTSSPH